MKIWAAISKLLIPRAEISGPMIDRTKRVLDARLVAATRTGAGPNRVAAVGHAERNRGAPSQMTQGCTSDTHIDPRRIRRHGSAGDKVAAQSAAGRAQAAKEQASTAVKASPELVGALSKEIGTTPEQAAGAAGALFGVAKSRLKADEFSRIAKAVPGITALLDAAPSIGAAPGGIGALSQVAGTTGSTGGLASAASAFSKLGQARSRRQSRARADIVRDKVGRRGHRSSARWRTQVSATTGGCRRADRPIRDSSDH